MSRVSKQLVFFLLLLFVIFSICRFGNFKSVSQQKKFEKLLQYIEVHDPMISVEETFKKDTPIHELENKDQLINLLRVAESPWKKEKKLYDFNIRYILEYESGEEIIIDTFQDQSEISLNGIIRFEEKGYSFFVPDDEGFTEENYRQLREQYAPR